MENRPRVLILVPEDWYLWSHRRPIADAARDAGFEVLIAARYDRHEQLMRDAGFRPIPIRLTRRSLNPIRELRAIADLVKIYRRERPCLVHHVTIKPVLYGSFAAWLAGVPAVVNAIAGLGHVFVARGVKAWLRRRVVILAYRLAFRITKAHLILQNPDDLAAVLRYGIVGPQNTSLIRGAGVDLEEFRCRSEPEGSPTIMFAGRVLWNKGVGDLVAAVRMLRQKRLGCKLVVVGIPDDANPKAIPTRQLRQWEREGMMEWWGRRDDMPNVLARSHVIALPTTYGEGVPKILLEAAAVGRAIVATNVTGCREIVRHGENGLLVEPNNVRALADALEDLLRNGKRRRHMGLRGREIAVAEFSKEQVVQETMSVYRTTLAARGIHVDDLVPVFDLSEASVSQ